MQSSTAGGSHTYTGDHGVHHRTHSFAIAIGFLAISATVALGAGPASSAADIGLATAAERTGFIVPVAKGWVEAGHEAADLDEDTSEDETLDEDTDEGELTEPAVHPDNHGAEVSEAARSETPAGWDNHGAYVSSVARDNRGQAQAAAHGGGAGSRDEDETEDETKDEGSED